MGLGAEVLFEAHDPRRADQTVHHGLRVVEVAEEGGSTHARGDTGRKLTIVDAVETEVTLAGIAHGRGASAVSPIFVVFRGSALGVPSLHLASIHQDPCQLWGPRGVGFAKIRGARPIGTCFETESASDAFFIVNNYCPFIVFPCCMDRTDWYTWRVLAMHTRSRKKSARHMWICADFLLNDRTIHDSRRNVVFCCACNGACVTSDAFGEVDDHAPCCRYFILSRAGKISVHGDERIFRWQGGLKHRCLLKEHGRKKV